MMGIFFFFFFFTANEGGTGTGQDEEIIDVALGWRTGSHCLSVIVSMLDLKFSVFFGVGREKTNGKLQTWDNPPIFHTFHAL